jgi:recombinational DNA repair protein RecT
MAKKTVFRSIFKWLPISIEAASAQSADSNVVNYTPPATASENPEDFIEIDFVAAAPEEGASE